MKEEPKPTKIQEKQQELAQLMAGMLLNPVNPQMGVEAIKILWSDYRARSINQAMMEAEVQANAGCDKDTTREQFEEKMISVLNAKIQELKEKKQQAMSNIVVAPKGTVIHHNSGGPH